MKIVSKNEFYKMPINTLYSNYSPVVFDGLKIKGETIYNSNNIPIDYYYEDLIGNVFCDSSEDYVNVLNDALSEKKSFKLDFNQQERDGLYEENTLFAIYEQKDVEAFITKLNSLKL